MNNWLTVTFLMLTTFQVHAKMRYFDAGDNPAHEVAFAAPDSKALVVYGVSDIPFGGWLSSSTPVRVGAGFFVGIRDNYDVPESTFLVNDLLTLRIGYIRRLQQTYRGALVDVSHMPLIFGVKPRLFSSDFYVSGEVGLSWLWLDCIEPGRESNEDYACYDLDAMLDPSGGVAMGAAALGLGYELGALDFKAEIFFPNLNLLWPEYSQKSIMLNLGYKFYSY